MKKTILILIIISSVYAAMIGQKTDYYVTELYKLCEQKDLYDTEWTKSDGHMYITITNDTLVEFVGSSMKLKLRELLKSSLTKAGADDVISKMYLATYKSDEIENIEVNFIINRNIVTNICHLTVIMPNGKDGYYIIMNRCKKLNN